MRFLLYNIRYGTGGQRRRLPISGYLGMTHNKLPSLIEFMRKVDADIIGLVEVDTGSYRARRRNQAEEIALSLGHYHIHAGKYTSRIANWLPVLNKQGNAFISRDSIQDEQFHYFSQGLKRLVIELELEDVVVFLVHLALSFRPRQQQLSDLYALVKDTAKPHIVAGDFNILGGERELRLFQAATGLKNANTQGRPTFPSWYPRRQLDFVLHSEHIRPVRFDMPAVRHSDHLPLVFDFEVE